MQIKTERLLLRPISTSDLQTTHAYAGDIENTEYMLYLPNRTIERTEEFLARASAEWAKEAPSFYEFAIELSGKHIGAVSLYLEHPGDIEFGWVLNREYCGYGYATEAALALKPLAIRLGAKRLIAHCDARNEPSKRVMEKLGMTLFSSDGIRHYPDERGDAPECMYSLEIDPVVIREAVPQDLQSLLGLYTHLHDNAIPKDSEALQKLWGEILVDPNHHIVVVSDNNAIVSSCVVLIVPNLTHNQRPYALVENVVTHPNHRGKGYATRTLDFARDIAVGCGCYKIMLMTGSKKDETLRFYERAGYNQGDKTAFVQWL